MSSLIEKRLKGVCENCGYEITAVNVPILWEHNETGSTHCFDGSDKTAVPDEDMFGDLTDVMNKLEKVEAELKALRSVMTYRESQLAHIKRVVSGISSTWTPLGSGK